MRARENFSGSETDTGRGRLLDADDCSMSIAIGGARTLHCHWRFAYRADEANALFERLHEALADCSGGAEPEADQQVNHPDSYDQRRFGIGGVPVSVSLKDKGALQQTLVFLAVEGILPDR